MPDVFVSRQLAGFLVDGRGGYGGYLSGGGHFSRSENPLHGRPARQRGEFAVRYTGEVQILRVQDVNRAVFARYVSGLMNQPR